MSTNSTLVLQPATVEDVPAITEVWFAAFTQPSIKYLFPDSPAMRKWHSDWHRGDMETKPYQKYLKVVDTSVQDKEGRPRLIAFGKWDLTSQEERGPRFREWCSESPQQACEDLIEGLEKERTRVMGGTKHYYLDTIGTHPDWQRRGASSMIVKWGCDLCDKDGVAAYVDASKEGARLYSNHGFKDYSPPDTEVAAMARFQPS